MERTCPTYVETSGRVLQYRLYTVYYGRMSGIPFPRISRNCLGLASFERGFVSLLVVMDSRIGSKQPPRRDKLQLQQLKSSMG
ncbi:hypothetical protein Naga_101335g2 [Nannochloropsis gaditana]|uniref:Uncharacterized protein n=1 Tax=Nannochloropsis gaditana TaxID=72520 RepID=W7TKA5_9STRA|nr:hypothetical protein Naga_101335g2 [Nannochloropsis gaditana]